MFLPNEIINLIFSFDSTYYLIFNNIIKEIDEKKYMISLNQRGDALTECLDIVDLEIVDKFDLLEELNYLSQELLGGNVEKILIYKKQIDLKNILLSKKKDIKKNFLETNQYDYYPDDFFKRCLLKNFRLTYSLID